VFVHYDLANRAVKEETLGLMALKEITLSVDGKSALDTRLTVAERCHCTAK
jgi:hypothetical protein